MMKRKVIQLAGKTFVVSLPNKWATKYKVKKGDELDVEEFNHKLVISQESEFNTANIKIDLAGLSGVAINRILGAIYKAGYDEAEVKFSSHDELDALLAAIREGFVGFEIVNRGKSSLILRNVAIIQYGEFETILRRIFLVVLSMAEEGLEAIKGKNKSLIQSVIFMDKDVNKYANFCRRALNKKGHSDLRKTPPLYYVVEQLEKLGDALRDICIYVQKTEYSPDKETILLHTKACGIMRTVYELHYAFDPKKASDFFALKTDLKESLFENIERKHDPKYLMLLLTAIETTFDLSGPIITLNL